MQRKVSWESLSAGAVLVEEEGGESSWRLCDSDYTRSASKITPVWSAETGFGINCVSSTKAGEVLHELRPQIAVAAHTGVGKICVQCFKQLPQKQTNRKRQLTYRESTCCDACMEAHSTIAAVRSVLEAQLEQQFPKTMLPRMMDLCTLLLRLLLPTEQRSPVQSQELMVMILSLERHIMHSWDQDTLLAFSTAAHAVWEAIRGADPCVAPLATVLSGPAQIVALLQACSLNAQPFDDILCLDGLLARINHSCAPNAYLQLVRQGTEIRVKLRAISEVSQGGHLAVTYFSELVQEVEHRRALLQEAFHFRCECKRCTTEDAAIQQLAPQLTATQQTRYKQAEAVIRRFEKADDFTSEEEAARTFQDLIDIVQMGGKFQELPPFAVFSYVRYRASVLALGAGLQAGMNDVIALAAATCADLWEVCGCAGLPERGELLTRSAQATIKEIEAGDAPVDLLRGVIGQLTEACKILGRSRGEDEQSTEAARLLLRKAVEMHQAQRK